MKSSTVEIGLFSGLLPWSILRSSIWAVFRRIQDSLRRQHSPSPEYSLAVLSRLHSCVNFYLILFYLRIYLLIHLLIYLFTYCARMSMHTHTCMTQVEGQLEELALSFTCYTLSQPQKYADDCPSFRLHEMFTHSHLSPSKKTHSPLQQNTITPPLTTFLIPPSLIIK